MIIGHHRNISYLERAIRRGRVAHAYCFYGPAAVGKRTVALAFSRSLLCARGARSPLGGCGQCEDCRLAAARTHPDLIALAPEELFIEEDGRGIGIKNVRELRRRLGQTAWRGGRRAVLVDGAEALTREAQSALLKVLEEPPTGTTFLLVAIGADALLPTIRSRSVPLGFSLVRDDELALIADGVPAGERTLLLALADGRPGVLAGLLAEPRALESARLDAERFQKLLDAGLAEQFAFAGSEPEPDRFRAFFRFLLAHSRRALWDAVARRGIAPAALAGFLADALGKLALLETTAVNRRLLAESVFVELALLRTGDRSGQAAAPHQDLRPGAV